MAPAIDLGLVRRLVDEQFPHWAGLPLSPVASPGWDNRSFRLGSTMVVRMPSAAEYAAQVAKEQRWLPRLAPMLPFPIPAPLALGNPAPGYPWPWSIYAWVEGEPSGVERVGDLRQFAMDLARFLGALRAADATDGPPPGPDNFFRGGSLAVYGPEIRRAIAMLERRIDARLAWSIWNDALAAPWTGPPVWVHGDVSPGNLLVRSGRLAGVIDFGGLAVGDPACDLSMAWTFFSGDSRDAFVARVSLDAGTWARARGWTLWKALVVAARIAGTNAVEWNQPLRTIEELARSRGAEA